MLVLILLFLAASLAIITAENITDSAVEKIVGEVSDLCENVSCDDSTLECPDGFIVSCSNSCDSKSGECSDCTLSCEGHEVIQPLNTTSELSEPPLENTTVLPTSNETDEVSDLNETQETIELNETVVENETEQTSDEDVDSTQDWTDQGA